MTTATPTDKPVRDVPPGTLVIYTASAGIYEYEGPARGHVAQIAFGYGTRREHHGLKCASAEVAPADTPIPVKDDRVAVTRQERGRYPTHQGPWLLTVDGQPRCFFATRRDGTAAGLRTVAVLDWHAGTTQAGPVVLPHTGMTVPHTRLALRALRSIPTSDGEAYTAELLVDGKPAGTIEHTGDGGDTMWHPRDRAVFSRTDIEAYVAACRNESGEPASEDFVLAELFEEARTARDVARLVDAGKLPVRTFAAITSDDRVANTFPDAYYGIPGGFGAADMRPRLAAVMWRDHPHAHTIQAWTGERWEDLPKPT